MHVHACIYVYIHACTGIIIIVLDILAINMLSSQQVPAMLLPMLPWFNWARATGTGYSWGVQSVQPGIWRTAAVRSCQWHSA